MTHLRHQSRPRQRMTLDTSARDMGGVTARVRVDGIAEPVEVRQLRNDTYRVSIEGHQFEVVVARDTDTDWGCVDGRVYRWSRGTPDDADAAAPTTDHMPIAATTPATVTAVMVAVDQTVARGDTLVVLEAMKMEMPLRAPRDGRVTAVLCAQGDQVNPGVPLVELDYIARS